VSLRDLLDAIGLCPLNTVTGFTVSQRLRLATDNPVVVEGAALILRGRSNLGGKHLSANYRIEREPRP
jgi:hypothetical protein